MQIEEGKTYQVKFLQEIEVDRRANDDPDTIMDTHTYQEGSTETAEIVDIYEEENIVSLYWTATTSDEIDTFAIVPLDSFKVIAKKIVTVVWEQA